ncbi:hypothetical protein LUZ60_017777 [Juncus effusus]|nr:hypothetical protein LUZ60_017777 [Juncus effusus]
MTVEVNRWLSEGFEEHTKDRGLILVGWAPQMVILSHHAVGGFMTHCGWNSVLESICMGVPMVTWPHFGDQFIDENLIVNVLNIGISLGVKTTNMGSLNVVVQRNDLRDAVVALMDDGEEAAKRRGRVKDLGKKAKKAMKDGGSSYLNMTDMIQYYVECGYNN